MNISLINEFTQLCSENGINVHDVIDAASTKPYGFMPFRPSVGVGGHCIPVDPLYLTWWARENGGEASLVELASSINISMPRYVAERALKLVNKDNRKPKVLVIGVAYKSGVSGVRETPAVQLIEHLTLLGAEVAWHDPLVEHWGGTESVSLDWNCDIAILSTQQDGIDFERLLSRGIQILDCTNSIASLSGVVLL